MARPASTSSPSRPSRYRPSWRRDLYRGRVRHSPYPLRAATVERLATSVPAAAGLPEPAASPLCHHSPGVDVEIFGLTPVPARRRAAA